LAFYPKIEKKKKERERKERAEEKKKDMSDEAFALFAQLVFFVSRKEKSLNHSKRKNCRARL
jgi:hypothetical protein